MTEHSSGSRETITYQVRDRSILLPLYKRVFVTPLLPVIPKEIHPNTITHAGHIVNLIGTALLLSIWPARGWPFAVAAFCLQFYNWCDNADGAHARRTNQASAGGEFLDHGLDMLNTTYIAYLVGTSLNATPLGWLAASLIFPAAAVFVYWEQAETGVFQLGVANQIESIFSLCVILLIATFLGSDWFNHVYIVGSVTLGQVILGSVVLTAFVGIFGGLSRVVRARGVVRLLPILPLLTFVAVLFPIYTDHILSAPWTVTLGTTGTWYLGTRMLTARMETREPSFDWLVPLVTVLLGALLVYSAWGPKQPTIAILVSAATSLIFGICGALRASAGIAALRRRCHTYEHQSH